MNNQQPIGIFDSGIGGLSVANAISRLLPNEQLIYFGDTAHLPYGEKSQDLIKKYSLRIADYLIDIKKCKCLVIACNTASAAAYEYLRDAHKGKIPIFNVIDPIIEAVIADETIKTIGVIATKTTISSGVYQEKFARRKSELKVKALAAPLLASLIEEGFYNNTISHAVIEKYLSDKTLDGIDGLVLGCTHYVMIKNEINEYYKGKVKLFDATDIMAAKVQNILQKEKLLSAKRENENEFYVSDFTDSFEKTAAVFYGSDIALKSIQL